MQEQLFELTQEPAGLDTAPPQPDIFKGRQVNRFHRSLFAYAHRGAPDRNWSDGDTRIAQVELGAPGLLTAWREAEGAVLATEAVEAHTAANRESVADALIPIAVGTAFMNAFAQGRGVSRAAQPSYRELYLPRVDRLALPKTQEELMNAGSMLMLFALSDMKHQVARLAGRKNAIRDTRTDCSAADKLLMAATLFDFARDEGFEDLMETDGTPEAISEAAYRRSEAAITATHAAIARSDIADIPTLAKLQNTGSGSFSALAEASPQTFLPGITRYLSKR